MSRPVVMKTELAASYSAQARSSRRCRPSLERKPGFRSGSSSRGAALLIGRPSLTQMLSDGRRRRYAGQARRSMQLARFGILWVLAGAAGCGGHDGASVAGSWTGTATDATGTWTLTG